MPQTDPFTGLVPRKMSDEELARAIRLNIAAECDAINLYAAHLDATDNDLARKMLAHIIEEEKEHLAEFLELLKILDPFQANELGEAKGKVDAIFAGTHGSHEHGGRPVEAAEAAVAEPPAEVHEPPALHAGISTVGSLRPSRQ